MVHEKRGTWLAINLERGKKGFATEAEALAWDQGEKLPEPEVETEVETEEE